MTHALYRERIAEVQKKLKDGEVLIVFAASHLIRNRDVDYKFRQDSDYYYLTGLDESDGIIILKNSYKSIFVLPKDKEKEIWTGIRVGKERAKELLRLDESFDTTEWESKLDEILLNQHTLYHFFGKNLVRDTRLIEWIYSLNQRSREGKFGPRRIESPDFLHWMRMFKSPMEIDALRESARITALGHERLMRESRPGMYEYELEAILESEYLKHGAWGGGYGHIVAGGKNATILHYTSNNCKLNDGELVLVDSGAEKGYYTADVTRNFPVGKKFSSEQKAVYEVVLKAQKEAVSNTKEGVEFVAIHEQAVRTLVEGLKDLGLLRGSTDSVLEQGTFKKYYMHRTSHYLGMDVHDVGTYYQNGASKKLESGQVITIEPGLYFDPNDLEIPEKFRGIGVRIEDDVLVQGSNPLNLTSMIPKEIDEIESRKN
ncbi:aminopeptidase P family protein [Leptospira borgpetersenii]|uniref:Xaa-Pro aminopeptidase n=3 Tax=Leptospira borgpetersenii TaxID=174 RepID=Q04TW3_LEPBJ|nr:aminopeptidase P family protein [Leptospira borgpetersenii]ABJ75657.1 Xaa-Pro aminopeptidase [Leptospira borgpetersenii serovar Hardjo-bovis str. JB197]ABJ79433.1 Xaa-Pro aminopeptidase [Leptospira borgpetersenii serovar Hardjo-bovis str. L550]AMX58757.1 Xaa-Pro aminopeptidase [Leptospira borgpetersenii serovar Hardjo]AMX62011.1 Xaa-Pro aminopeptidase [Leptospira borgpetersenii serovar Hardjo]AMX65254.1 Xaa-Pro aminopeptidase [Leptospira borgpetersenii serovar Hardjo]